MSHASSVELLRYGAVSVIALALDLSIMHLLIEMAGLPLVAASATGFALGMVMAYVLSCRWAFRHSGHVPTWRGWVAFSAIGVVGLVLNSALVWLCTATLGLAWPLAKLMAASGSFSFNFLIRRLVLFLPGVDSPGPPR